MIWVVVTSEEPSVLALLGVTEVRVGENGQIEYWSNRGGLEGWYSCVDSVHADPADALARFVELRDEGDDG